MLLALFLTLFLTLFLLGLLFLIIGIVKKDDGLRIAGGYYMVMTSMALVYILILIIEGVRV